LQREDADASLAHLRDVHSVAAVDGEFGREDQLPGLVAASGELGHEGEPRVEDLHRALEPVDDQEVSLAVSRDASGYVETARTLKMRPMPLNQKPDEEYEKLWNSLEDTKALKIKRPEEVYTFGHNLFNASVCA